MGINMDAQLESFTRFVNIELPKRVSTSADPLTTSAGLIPITTGVGLNVEFVDRDSLIPKKGIVTASKLPIRNDGTVVLPQKPYGGVLWDIALIYLTDGSVLEVTDVYIENEKILVIQPTDYEVLKDIAVSATVSFIGDLNNPI